MSRAKPENNFTYSDRNSLGKYLGARLNFYGGKISIIKCKRSGNNMSIRCRINDIKVVEDDSILIDHINIIFNMNFESYMLFKRNKKNIRFSAIVKEYRHSSYRTIDTLFKNIEKGVPNGLNDYPWRTYGLFKIHIDKSFEERSS